MNTQSQNPNPPNAPDPLAVALSKLDPAPHGFDWNALMFAAGRASKARALTFWRAVACVCAIAACAFAFAYLARIPAVTERVVYIERPATKTAAPLPKPVVPATPEPLPLPKPPAPAPEASSGPDWSFDPPPERGAAAHWLTQRNEVLTVGLGVLPDNGRKVSGPRAK